MPRTVEFEIPKNRREVSVFKADAMTVQAMPSDARKGMEVDENLTTIVRIKPQDIPELIRWARSNYKEWLKTQPGQGKSDKPGMTRRIDVDLDDLGEDGDDDAI
jgi:hypothetical protein